MRLAHGLSGKANKTRQRDFVIDAALWRPWTVIGTRCKGGSLLGRRLHVSAWEGRRYLIFALLAVTAFPAAGIRVKSCQDWIILKWWCNVGFGREKENKIFDPTGPQEPHPATFGASLIAQERFNVIFLQMWFTEPFAPIQRAPKTNLQLKIWFLLVYSVTQIPALHVFNFLWTIKQDCVGDCK